MLGWLARASVVALVLATAAEAQETPAPATPIPTPTPGPEAARPTLSLSLQDAVARTLENNLDIAVQRYEPEDQAQAVKQLRGFYDPLLSSTLLRSSSTEPARSALTGSPTDESDVNTYNFGVNQNLPTGGNFSVDFTNNRVESNSVLNVLNPTFSSGMDLRLNQPLLRDRGIDSQRLQLRIAKRNKDISDIQFRQTVVNTVASVKQLYYDLIYAIDNLEAQRKSLALASKLLDENQIKVRVGTMAPLDVVAAESEVAGREEAVIVAEAAVFDAEDQLRRAIFKDNAAENWTLRILPTDRPSADPSPVDANGAVLTALEKRTDVVAARKNLESSFDQQKFARNQKLPAVDLQAAYGTSGLSGTRVRDANGDPIVSPVSGGFGDSLGTVFGFDFPTWTVGFQVTYPLFNRAASASEARARLSREQAEVSLRRLEIQVTQEVRSAARAVETNFKRVQSTQAARVLQERRLDAEQKRFNAGMSTNFLVTQSQRDLAVAEVAELRAIADYRKSIVNFERVQEAGGNGISFASSSSTAANGNRTTASGTTSTTGQTSNNGLPTQ
jgi:outer membrane protein TolC